MKFLTIMMCLLAFVTLPLRSEQIKSGTFQAHSDGENVTLRWVSDDEQNVVRYVIERRTGIDGEFMPIGTMEPRGSSAYEFVDYSAFRKTVTVYQYRIKIELNQGHVYSGTLSVSHAVSGVLRTWGSIKALFR
jgi:hypothetical protein